MNKTMLGKLDFKFLNPTLFAFLTFLICMWFSARGFNLGFTDIGHDSYVLKVASDLNGGATLFKNTFTQYGIIGDHLNALILRLHNRLIFIKFVYSVIYSICCYIIYKSTKLSSSHRAAILVSCFFIASGPFYRHGIMLSVHTYILLVQLGVVSNLRKFFSYGSKRALIYTSFLSAFVFLLKQNYGIFQIFLISICLLSPVVKKRLRVVGLYFGIILVTIAPFFLKLIYEGTITDWYIQTVEFPRLFYTEYILSTEELFTNSRAPFEGLPLLSFLKNIPWPIFAFIELFFNQPYWMILRLALFFLALNQIRTGRTRDSGIVMLIIVSSGTLVLWPSGNFMHQWWTLAPVFPLIPKAINELGLSERMFLDRKPFRSMRPVIPTLGQVICIAMLANVFFSGGNFWTGNFAAAIGTITRPCVEFKSPEVLEGICSTEEFIDEINYISAKASVIHQIELIQFKKSRVITQDSADGVSEILIALLPVATLSGNSSISPLLWNLPVLSKLYPESHLVKLQNHNVIVDLSPTNTKLIPFGYRINSELRSDVFVGKTWRIFTVDT